MPVSEEKRAMLKQAFDQIDSDNSGEVCANELLQLIQSQGCNCTMVQINSFLSAHDKDSNGKLNFEEFLELLVSLGF